MSKRKRKPEQLVPKAGERLAGIGIFDHWREPQQPPEPDAGIGLFSNYRDDIPKDEPGAGLGVFRHWIED